MRYLAVSKPNNPETPGGAGEAALTARGVQKVALQNVIVYVGEGPQIRFEGGNGVIIGALFDNAYRTVERLNPAVQLAILASEGRDLIKSFWGNYVAILSVVGRTIVVRSPGGDVACNFCDSESGVSVSSDVKLLLAASARVPTIDFDAIKLHLQAISLRPRRTAIGGVNELLRGERLTISADGVTTIDTVWSPWDAALTSRHAKQEPAEEAEAVREAAYGCVHALSRSTSKVLLDLSGGLDSSIVAAALSRAGTEFHCLNFRTSQSSGDERDFARLVAERLDVPLHEVELSISDVDLSRSAAAHLARPTARSFIQAWDVIGSRVAADTGATAYFNGAGGDNVFCSLQSPAPVADRVLVGGIGLGPLRVASDLSAITGCSVWTALRRGIQRAWLMPASYRWHADNSFLAFAGKTILPDCVHPWLSVPPEGLPGSAGHIAQLLQIENHLEGFARAKHGRMYFPLLAQPLVEACLKIPSWKWIEGGMNRHVARAAFRDDLPAALLSRRSKGRPESFLVDLFEARRSQIREMLGDGILVENGLVDFPAIARLLDQTGPVRSLHYTRILRLVDVEAWLQHWSGITKGQLRCESLLPGFEQRPP